MKLIVSSVLLFFLLNCTISLEGQSLNTEIRSVMEEIYPANAPGAALLVLQGDETVIDTGFGLANPESREMVTPATHFRMASVSKQFTAMAILKLQKKGMLFIDDPAIRYLPSLPAFADKITIRQLMTHTSGIADYENLIPEGQKKQVNDADVLRLISHSDSLYFAPGTQFRYSNTGFCLLTQIAEKVSGIPYPDLMKKLIFDPLKMNHSVIYQSDEKIFDRAYGYHNSSGEWRFADQSLTSATMGDGSVYTSTDEYRKWVNYLWKFVPSDEASNPVVPQAHVRKGLDYGFGWFVSAEQDGSVGLFHSGESTGFHNIVYQNPSKKLLIVIFTNSDDDRVGKAFDKVSRLMNIRPDAAPEGVSLFDYLSRIYGD